MLLSDCFDLRPFPSHKRPCTSWPSLLAEPTSVLDSRTPSPTSTGSSSSSSPPLPSVPDLLSEVVSQGFAGFPHAGQFLPLRPVDCDRSCLGGNWCDWTSVGSSGGGNDGLLEDVAGISAASFRSNFEGSLVSALGDNPTSPALAVAGNNNCTLPVASDEDESLFIGWLLAQGLPPASSTATDNDTFQLPNGPARQSIIEQQQYRQTTTPVFPSFPSMPAWQAPPGAMLPSVGLPMWQQRLPEHEKISQRWAGSNDGQLSIAMDQLSVFIEALDLGNSDLTQAILARLNQLLPTPHVGNPLQRSAFYFKEALAAKSSLLVCNQSPNPNTSLATSTLNALNQPSLVHNQTPLFNPNPNPNPNSSFTPYTLDFLQKIMAATDYSKFSPLHTFAHFTCNQAILEALGDRSNIHIVDFDPGLGGQWSSLLQDLALRITPVRKLSMTLVGSNFLEMQCTQENLSQFASGLCLPLQIKTVSISNCVDYLAETALEARESGEEEGLAINFGNGGYQLYSEFSTVPTLLAFLSFLKGLSPRVVTVAEEELETSEEDNNATPLCRYLLQRLKQYAFVLDSLESSSVAAAVAMNKMEQYVVESQIRAIVEATLRRSRNGVDLSAQSWPSLLHKVGFTKKSASTYAELQAEIVLKHLNNHNKGGVGFSIGNENGTLILNWKERHLAAASAWIYQN